MGELATPLFRKIKFAFRLKQFFNCLKASSTSQVNEFKLKEQAFEKKNRKIEQKNFKIKFL